MRTAEKKGCDAIRLEIAKEQAEELGRSERKLLAAREALRRLDARAATAKPGERERALGGYADALTSFVVHREACGLRDAAFVFAFYEIPVEVVARMGVRARAETP
jgi:hypothetical protein